MKGISNRKTQFSWGSLAWLTFIVFVVFILFFRSPLQSLFLRIAAPIVSARTPLGGLWAQFSSKASLASQNETLQTELASTTATLADRNVLYQENLQLKSELGRNAGVRTILAKVIMRPPATPYDTLLIDTGSQEGLAPEDTVYAGGTMAIGMVTSVYPTSARVTLFSSPGETYSASVHTIDGKDLPLSVIGQGGGSLNAKVPTGSAVSVGDSVTLSGLQGGFVGTVSAVSASKDQSFETLYVQESINPFTLDHVGIGKTTYGQ